MKKIKEKFIKIILAFCSVFVALLLSDGASYFLVYLHPRVPSYLGKPLNGVVNDSGKSWLWVKDEKFNRLMKKMKNQKLFARGKKYIASEIQQISPVDNKLLFPENFFRASEFDTVPLRIFEHQQIIGKNKNFFTQKVLYSFDNHYRRTDPLMNQHFGPKVVLFGGSFVMGERLPDEETLAHQIMKYANGQLRVYNLGFFGNGPNDILYNLNKSDINYLDELDDARIFIYCFPSFHIDRVIGPSYALKETDHWMLKKPWYDLNEQGFLIYRGTLEDKPYKWFYRSFHSTHFSRAFDIKFPFKWRERDYKLVAKIFSEISHKIKMKAPGSVFYVLLYPPWGIDTYSAMKAELALQGVQVIDLAGLPIEQVTEKLNKIPLDGHPTGLSNYVLAKAIIKELRLSEKK